MDIARSREQIKDPDKALEPELDRQVKAICRQELDILYPELLSGLKTD